MSMTICLVVAGKKKTTMINNATTNGEKPERIELLEMRLNRISSKIDQENIRLYGGEAING